MSSIDFRSFDPPLDPGILRAVELLNEGGIETYESCEGGDGHAYTEPTVRFFGAQAEGYKALAIALEHGLPVQALKRIWEVRDGEACGPNWEIVFWKKLESLS